MRNLHVCQSVRGALRNWNKRQMANAFVHGDGRKMSAYEAREALFNELAKGHEVIPIGPACEGFDYKTGCPGHEVEG